MIFAQKRHKNPKLIKKHRVLYQGFKITMLISVKIERHALLI